MSINIFFAMLIFIIALAAIFGVMLFRIICRNNNDISSFVERNKFVIQQLNRINSEQKIRIEELKSLLESRKDI
jgi:hypothetical protein